MIFGTVSVAFWSGAQEHMYHVECTYITSHHLIESPMGAISDFTHCEPLNTKCR